MIMYSIEAQEAAVLAERLYRIWLLNPLKFYMQVEALDEFIFDKKPLPDDLRKTLQDFAMIRSNGDLSFFAEAMMRSHFGRHEFDDGRMRLTYTRSFGREQFMREFDALLEKHQSLGLDGVKPFDALEL